MKYAESLRQPYLQRLFKQKIIGRKNVHIGETTAPSELEKLETLKNTRNT